MMRRFELTEGKSNKFWQIGVAGDTLTVIFGRIGTAGQTKSKTFTDHAAALKEEVRLVREKTDKGYREVGTNPTGYAPAASAAHTESAVMRGVTSEAQNNVTATILPESDILAFVGKVTTADTATGTADIVWPSGGFNWNDAWLSRVPVIRGTHVPPFSLLLNLWNDLPVFCGEEVNPHVLKKLMETGARLDEKPWTQAQGNKKLQRNRLQQKDEVYWQQVYYQCALVNCRYPEGGYFVKYDALRWALEAAITLHALGFALEMFLSCGESINLPGMNVPDWLKYSPQAFLRHAIAAAEPAVWQECVDIAQEYRGQSALLDCVISYLFPENMVWAQECMQLQPCEETWRLQHCAITPEDWCRLQSHEEFIYWTESLQDCLALQFRLHGEKAVPILALILNRLKKWRADNLSEALACVQRLQTPAMLEIVISHFEQKEVRRVVDKLIQRWPEAILLTAIRHVCRQRLPDLENWLKLRLIGAPERLVNIKAYLTDSEQVWLAATMQSCRPKVAAAPEGIPQWLREPPWLDKQRPTALPVLALVPIPCAPQLRWRQGEREKWCRRYTGMKMLDDRQEILNCLSQLGFRESAYDILLAGKSPDPWDLVMQHRWFYPKLLLSLPEALALSVWNFMSSEEWLLGSDELPYLQTLLARYGLPLLPGVLKLLTHNVELGLKLALPVGSVDIAPHAAHACKNTRKAAAVAREWLLRHPETAMLALIPAALGKNKKVADNARYALRFLTHHGHEALLRSMTSQYGAQTEQAVAQWLAQDPLLFLPAKMPPLPSFFVPALFFSPQLHSGEALPEQAISYLGNMLSISTLDNPYAGLQMVKEVCSAESLARFAWDLYQAWLSADAPNKERWAYTALGLLGNDETVQQLTPLLRQWPLEGLHARAMTGLDILAAIGSDVALRHLLDIAVKPHSKGLQNGAREKIAEIAEQRGFSVEQLADLLVPDLGLDNTGSLNLDFGPRQFTVAFDEDLKPYLKDAQNVRLQDLPRPNRSDDAELSAQTVARWKTLKKEARALIGMQVQRLEASMCRRRRWTAVEFRTLFIEHPLMRHLSRRLLWGVYQKDVLVQTFRVAEDLTLADHQDESWQLPVESSVGIAHALELSSDTVDAFARIFADYEIVQPFKQLGRETYALTEAEISTGSITRFRDKVVASGNVLGLVNRGWQRGEVQDGGVIGWFCRPLTDDIWMTMILDPGIVAGDSSYEPTQRITEMICQQDWDIILPLGQVDAVMISEILRDADLLPTI